MDAIARRLGVKARIVQYNWSNLVPSLERGDFDIAMNGLEATDGARRAHPAVASRTSSMPRRSRSARDAPYKSLADLKGKRVGTLNQTYAHDLLRAQPLEARALRGQRRAVHRPRARPHRRACCSTTSSPIATAARAAELKCLPDDVARGTYVIGIRKSDPELKRAIDDALDAMRADGELERILAQGEPVGHAPDRGAAADRPDVHGARARSTATCSGSSSRPRSSRSSSALLAFLLAVPIGIAARDRARLRRRRSLGALARDLHRAVPRHAGAAAAVRPLLRPRAVLQPRADAGRACSASASTTARTRPRSTAARCSRSRAARPRRRRRSAWRRRQILRHVLLPQALRLALPPMTNDFVSLLKDSSLVSVITVIELTKRMTIAAVDMRGWLVPGPACARRSTSRSASRCRSWRGGSRGGWRVISVRKLSKRHGARDVLRERQRRGRAAARRSRSSGRRAAASRRCCAASTTSRAFDERRGRDRGRASCGPAWRARDGELLRALRAKVGMVFQQFNLFPHLTALENITLAPRVVRRLDASRRREARARELLERVGLGDRARRVSRTSCRAGSSSASRSRARSRRIPRCCCSTSRPSALDPEMRDEVMEVIKDLAARRHDDARRHPRDAVRARHRDRACG